MHLFKHLATISAALILASCNSDGGGLNKAEDNKDNKEGAGLNRAKVDYSLGRAMNQKLGRGINMGNSWESVGSGTHPDCGWGNCLKDEDLQIVKAAGFNSVRIPVRWENDVDINNTIDAGRLAGVKEDIKLANALGMPVVVNFHHHEGMNSAAANAEDDPVTYQEELQKFATMWAQVAAGLNDIPDDMIVFEIMNEPHMYNKDQLRNLYAEWIQKFPKVPRDHIILDGSGMAQNVPDIASDSRFDGCLFAVHEYTFWNMSINTEQGWKNSFKGKVGNFVDRTVCTEWGGAMAPGDKAGVHYETMDYNQQPTNYFMAYIRGMSDQLREWEMGSFYWPGLRDGDWYSMTKRSGEGANIKLEVVNQSGLDRMQHSWADTVAVVPPDTIPADTSAAPADSNTIAPTDSNVTAPDSSMAIGARAVPDVRTNVLKNSKYLRVKGNKTYIEKNGIRFDLTGHRIK